MLTGSGPVRSRRRHRQTVDDWRPGKRSAKGSPGLVSWMSDREARLADADAGRLDERVLTALQGLSGRLAFSGLRRYLGTHPESLSRSLRRLRREGLIERTDGGYRALTAGPAVATSPEEDLRAIARIELPTTASPAEFLGSLAGRWFGSLRWVGVLDRPEGELLAWARRDGGGLVLLGLRASALSVYLPTRRPDEDPAKAEEAAYDLLFHAVEALRASPVGAPPPVALVRAFAADPAAPSFAS
jgi:hypothetical protein